MTLFEEDEFVEEFDSETNKSAKAFIVYGDIHDSEGILTLLRELNLLDESSVTSDDSCVKIKGNYSVLSTFQNQKAIIIVMHWVQ